MNDPDARISSVVSSRGWSARRIGTVCMWIGVVASAASVSLWILSVASNFRLSLGRWSGDFGAGTAVLGRTPWNGHPSSLDFGPGMGWDLVWQHAFRFDCAAQGGLWVLIFPLWAPSGTLIVATSVLAVRLRRRRPAGTCGNCGYSLVGLLGEQCPECGVGPGRSDERASRK